MISVAPDPISFTAPSHAYLIVCVTVCALAVGVAGWQREPWRVLMAIGLGALALSFVVR